MKAKVLPYLIFFLVSLGFAYYSSGPGKERNSEGQEWIAMPKGSIEAIHYEDEERSADLVREGGSDQYWIKAKTLKPKPEDKGPAEERFLANENLNEALDGLYTFRVKKVIGAAKDLKLDHFGLDKPSGRFQVTYAKDKTFSLILGKRGFQSADVFALDEAKQQIVLVDKQLLAPFERAKARLALLTPYRLKPDDISAATLSVDDKHMEYVRQSKGGNKVWLARDKPDVPSESFSNWLDKLLKIRIEGYPDEAQIAAMEQLPRKFSVLLKSDKAELDLFTVLEDTSATPPRYWLQNKSLPVPVMVESSKVTMLLSDIAGLSK